MGSVREHNRCFERIEKLAAACLDPDAARRSAIEILHAAVGFGSWCWPLTDPDTAISSCGIGELDLWPALARMVALEEHGDITSRQRVAGRLRQRSQLLSAVTNGDLARSRRWQECLDPYGIGDQLMTPCQDRHGCWGTLDLMRDRADGPFEEDDVRLLDELAPVLGTLLRRSATTAWSGDRAETHPRPPGTLILDGELRPTSWTPSFKEWLVELPSATIYTKAGMLPTAVYRIGARVLAPADPTSLSLPARVRYRQGPPEGRVREDRGAQQARADLAAGGAAVRSRPRRRRHCSGLTSPHVWPSHGPAVLFSRPAGNGPTISWP